MGSGGIRINRKPKPEPTEPREPDISSTSGARRYLRMAEKAGKPEQLAEAQAKVAEAHPDMLIERRSH